ncbi:MAG TPA: nucleotidyltransferase family protein [Fimbriimonadaceae bacterium]|nr:nucleotidyltransferase family protein [Fimbriimonadaceae bacterium]
MKHIVAIVPAAGLSRRFGGPNKLLQPFGGTTVVGAVIGRLAEAGLPVVVVTGRDAELVAQAVTRVEVPGHTTCVLNPDWETGGLGSSIAVGVGAAPQADGYLIALGDMPGLRVEAIRSLIECFEQGSSDSIVAPTYAEDPAQPGHPVHFGSAHRDALAALSGDEGARSILRANPDKLIRLPLAGRLEDIDRPEDLL